MQVLPVAGLLVIENKSSDHTCSLIGLSRPVDELMKLKLEINTRGCRC